MLKFEKRRKMQKELKKIAQLKYYGRKEIRIKYGKINRIQK